MTKDERSIDILNNLYDKQKYLDLYGGSVIFSILFMIAFFILVSYIQISGKFAVIRKDWPKHRCNPQVIPFAGLIVKEPGKTVLESSASNFTNCTNTILSNISGYYVSPIYYITNTLQTLINGLINNVQQIRKKISSVGSNFGNVDSTIMGKIMGFMVPLRIYVIKLKNMMAKTNATLVGGVFTAIGGYLGLKAFLGAFIILMAIAFAVAMAIAAALSNPFTFPAAIPFYAIAAFIAFTLVFIGIVQVMVKQRT